MFLTGIPAHLKLSHKHRVILKSPQALLSTPEISHSGTISNKVPEELTAVCLSEKVTLQRESAAGRQHCRGRNAPSFPESTWPFVSQDGALSCRDPRFRPPLTPVFPQAPHPFSAQSTQLSSPGDRPRRTELFSFLPPPALTSLESERLGDLEAPLCQVTVG